MELINDQAVQKILQLTWRNPAFMAVAIALIWLIPQLILKKLMTKNYEKSKYKKQQQEISKLYPPLYK